jgi:hypothetical protein
MRRSNWRDALERLGLVPMQPYDVDFSVNRIGVEIKKAYGLKGRTPGDDPGYADWPGRIWYDIRAGMDPEAALAKHLYGPGELYESLGIPLPFVPAPREYHGQMCGIHVAGLSPIAGVADPTLVLSWLLPAYNSTDQAAIVQAYRAKGYVDFLLDWAYARSVGYDVPRFVALCIWLRAQGCRPVPMLCSKDFDPHNNLAGLLANITPLLSPMIESHAVSRVGVGFELGINGWLTALEVQHLIDAVTAMLNPSGIRCYVHFQPGYPSFQQSGTTGDFWHLNVGKLAGLFAQSRPEDTMSATRDWFNDVLERCAGNDNWPAVVMDGHGVDCIALELTASRQFAGTMTEAQGDDFALYIWETPPRTGPAGTARILGSGNGG